MLHTAHLELRRWQAHHRDAFADMHADLEVMADQGGPINRAASDIKFDRYQAAFEDVGISRWAVEDEDGRFLGYSGVMKRADPGHPLGPHYEVGWRLVRWAWGRGYASESAKAALLHAFGSLETNEILSYTNERNHRSQAVMKRLGLRRDPSRDFTAGYDNVGQWQGLVWCADR